MKKLCFFCGSLNSSGGTERVSTIIGNKLSDKYEVFFLSLCCGDNPYFELNDNIKVDYLFEHKVSFIKNIFPAILKLRRYVKENNIDVLINVESLLCLFSVPALTFLDVKNICWEHFNFKVNLGLKSRTIARHLATRFCDDIIVLTERDREMWLENTYHKSNISVVNNPSSCLISNVEKNNNKLLLSVGRLSYQKGYDLLLEAWRIVILTRKDWRLKIIGNGEDYHKLKKIITDYQLEDSVELIEETKDIETYYLSSSLYVMSSRFEGFPMVLLEASSYGLPMISFDCNTGPSEIITEDCGWLCQPNDYIKLSKCMLKAFNECDDNEKYNNLSLSAYENSKRFCIKNIIEDWNYILGRYEQ
ncbi:glycosyltransferase family 4 protein [Photobacterium phosphoreum]|uniref:glycosyltransferase family 4 protein n=1 Tax=Photobacterium phosphoreum TaxID=659 RepID=UPI000D16A544|nr:glycosyltransferase family 4 protein [Photobacterium phosphoreum]PSW25651.1 glycosyltransferase family 4 protein [Photobacterium phosphoreum]